jgi:predicted P-loop ATPase
MLLIGSIQRSYYPGCDLPRLITLYSAQQIHKSTLCRLLAGNTTFNGYQWFTDKNLLKEKNEVSRYSYTVGNAIIEFGERNFAGVTIEEFKQFVSSMKDVRRPLFKNEAEKRLRWYDCIATTNKFQYNTDTENLRDWGIPVGVGGKMIDTDRFLEVRDKIFGWAVWNVKRGMSGAPDIRLRDIARTHLEERIEYNDTMELLEPVFAFAHLCDKDGNGDRIIGIVPQEKGLEIMEKYEISYKFDKELQKQIYLISSVGLRNFATDYSNFMKRHNIPIHKRAI